MSTQSYSRDLDILVALISNLSLGEYSQRTPEGLSTDLSITTDEIRRVLRAYKSLFREATKPKPGAKIKPFSLHLRHALQYVQDGTAIKKPPIQTEHVTLLIEFVSNMARDEKSRGSQYWIAIVAAFAALVAALIALLGEG